MTSLVDQIDSLVRALENIDARDPDGRFQLEELSRRSVEVSRELSVAIAQFKGQENPVKTAIVLQRHSQMLLKVCRLQQEFRMRLTRLEPQRKMA